MESHTHVGESYTPVQVREIIIAYIDIIEAKTYFLERKTSDNIIEKTKGIERLEGALINLKRLTSTKLREILPKINIENLENLCKQAWGK